MISGNVIIDQAYFESYANPKIHEDMLNDIVRMKYYEAAIQKVVQGKTVVDVGAGTGVLSLLSAKAGAVKVFAVEQSDIVKTAQTAIKDNNFVNTIIIYKEKAEEVQLPIQKVDVIISEWMGYALIYENMLPSVLYIRDKYLKEGGDIIPHRAQLFICALHKNINQNGLNLSSVNKSMNEKARVEIILKEQQVTDSMAILDLALDYCQINQNIFDSEFQLKAQKSDVVNGFALWFKVFLTDDIILSTSPDDPETHWKQTVLLLKKEFLLKEDEIVQGTIKIRPQKENYRALEFTIYYQSQGMTKRAKQIFYMD